MAIFLSNRTETRCGSSEIRVSYRKAQILLYGTRYFFIVSTFPKGVIPPVNKMTPFYYIPRGAGRSCHIGSIF
jgi:hypothetical protein